MIYITNIRHCEEVPYDEIWGIVRSMKSKSKKIRQVTELAPSTSLYQKHLKWKEEGIWNQETFDEEYVPLFLKELKQAKNTLNQLYKLDKVGKNIVLCCFCTEESLCHRSIIAGLLQGAGCDVKGVDADYRKYWEMYKNL